MRNLLILLTISISSLTMAQDNNTAVVLELFTSQGCSSCPPADELLDAIKNEHEKDNVFVLSYHVDYWNRLGWRDPFSDEAFSDYQRDYAQQFNSRSIYTPQLVVNGSEHFTGSNSTKARTALNRYSKSDTSNKITLSNVKRGQKEIAMQYEVEGNNFDKITLALVISERVTKIGRGENRNRTLKNTNIVANRLVKRNASGTINISVPDWVDAKDELAIIAYTQSSSLKTTGATKVQI